jgi:hypothetical protein
MGGSHAVISALQQPMLQLNAGTHVCVPTVAGCTAHTLHTVWAGPANAAASCSYLLLALKAQAACVVKSGAAAAAVCSGLPESFSLLPLQGGPARCNTSGCNTSGCNTSGW